uniref:RanBD1 domain-containing protein n=1 Tax=Steinernema glaseri TaxID=37863 RepID=A0A1I8AVZ5_9BILA
MNPTPSCASWTSESDDEEKIWAENDFAVLSEVSTDDECLAERKKTGVLVPARKEFLEMMSTPPWNARRPNLNAPLAVRTLVEAQTQVFVAFKERLDRSVTESKLLMWGSRKPDFDVQFFISPKTAHVTKIVATACCLETVSHGHWVWGAQKPAQGDRTTTKIKAESVEGGRLLLASAR